MKNDDELLDEVIRYLRSEPAPEMPAVLADRRVVKPRRWFWGAAAAGALAASLVGFLVWLSRTPSAPEPRRPALRSRTPSTPEPQPPAAEPALAPALAKQADRDTPESEIVVRGVDLAEPFAQLEANLDSISAEIAELRMQADLLDARRRTEELISRHALTSVDANGG